MNIKHLDDAKLYKCLKCGSQSNLRAFTHTETITSRDKFGSSTWYRHATVPLCSRCYSELSQWKEAHRSTGRFVGRRILGKQEDNPHRYISFRWKGTCVRPKGIGDWVKYKEWLKKVDIRGNIPIDIAVDDSDIVGELNLRSSIAPSHIEVIIKNVKKLITINILDGKLRNQKDEIIAYIKENIHIKKKKNKENI